jgi:ribosomal-protein-alanine N-acetyltransferase
MLSVSNKYQNLGVGSLLLMNLLRELILHNIKFVELEVSTKNHRAVNFYNKHGFEVKDIIKMFYENGDDAFIMKLIF